MIDIAVAPIGSTTVSVVVSGEIDMLTAPQVQAALIDIVNTRRPRCILVDAAGVGFLDAVGMSALIRAYRHAHHHHADVRLINVRPHVMKVLHIVNLLEVYQGSWTCPPA